MGSLILVRHATTAASQAGANLGQASDPPLTEDGRLLAARVGRAIALELEGLPRGEVQLVSSPAQRCRQTAEAIGMALDVEPAPLVEDGLREIDYGAWEGLTPDECSRRDPELRQAWEADPYATRAPGGESGSDVAGRTFPVLERIEARLAADRGRVELVVAHNHVVRLRLAALMGLPMADYRRRLEIRPGSYSIVTFGADVPAFRRIGTLPAMGRATAGTYNA
jgi:broad specificity phosphatase PhoE